MRLRAATTVLHPRDEAQRLWAVHRSERLADAEVTFTDAPGDRGTEIHVDLEHSPRGGKLGEKLTGTEAFAKLKDDLRHFKQLAETGEVPRSDASPEGERFERKLKQRPAQPLDETELEKAGV
jgi:uncharacterized membrane protein